MTSLNTLRDGLLDQLKDLYSAETQLLKALPKMEKKATNQKLKSAISSHLKETEGHLARLQEISALVNQKLTGKTCKAMAGLIEEGKEVLEEDSENDALIDTLIIGAAQRVEHYEMAAYGTVRAMAEELGEDKVAGILEETLQEEKDADQMLTSISEGGVLADACALAVDDEEDEKMVPRRPSRGKASGAMKVFTLIGAILISYNVASKVSAETVTKPDKNKAVTAPKNDNTAVNVRDREGSSLTADDQKLSGEALKVVAKIRKEIVANSSLSTNGHNVKIVVQDRVVTLRGPVNSAEEKARIEQATAKVSSGYTVVNQLEVTPS